MVTCAHCHNVVGENSELEPSPFHSKRSSSLLFVQERDYSLKAGCANNPRDDLVKSSQSLDSWHASKTSKSTRNSWRAVSRHTISSTFKPRFQIIPPPQCIPQLHQSTQLLPSLNSHHDTSQLSVALSHIPVLFHIKIMFSLPRMILCLFERLKKEMIL